jgi:uncharacterized protein (TIGR03437 family)
MPAGVLVSAANWRAGPLQISFGNTAARLTYSGLAPLAAGLCQFHVVVPEVPDDNALGMTIFIGEGQAAR